MIADEASAAERYGQGVGHIGRRGQLGQIPDGLYGSLHLQLGRVPVAGHRLLDAVGGELLDAHAAPPIRIAVRGWA